MKQAAQSLRPASPRADLIRLASTKQSYAAAKGAILSMTRHMAMEGRSVGIRANSVSPGLIETHQTRPLLNDSSWSGPMLDKIMLGRVGQP